MLTIIEEMEVLFITDDDELGGWVGCFGCGPTAGVALEGGLGLFSLGVGGVG